MKYYLRKLNEYGFMYYNGNGSYSIALYTYPFDTIESAKSKGQELGGEFQIVNERFEVVWPVK